MRFTSLLFVCFCLARYMLSTPNISIFMQPSPSILFLSIYQVTPAFLDKPEHELYSQWKIQKKYEWNRTRILKHIHSHSYLFPPKTENYFTHDAATESLEMPTSTIRTSGVARWWSRETLTSRTSYTRERGHYVAAVQEEDARRRP